MKTIEEKTRHIPILKQTDVLVAGGGTAGSVAAIAAAREGAKVLVVEEMGFLGGTNSGGLVTPMMENKYEQTDLIKGINAEINDRLIGKGAGLEVDNCFFYDPEQLKFVLDEMFRENDVEVLFHTYVSDVIKEGNDFRGVICQNKGGRFAVLGKVSVDATGDADLAYMSGVPVENGREKDSLNQAVSLRFIVGNVDSEKLKQFLRKYSSENPGMLAHLNAESAVISGGGFSELFQQAKTDGMLKGDDPERLQFFSVPGRPGEINFNSPDIGMIAPLAVDGLTKAQARGREIIGRLVGFLRKYIVGFEDSYLATTAPMVGVRDSRRIKGEYTLTEDDIRSGKECADAICYCNYPIDIHKSRNDECTHLEELNKPYAIPYRSTVPLQVENLLVAGRCISASFVAQSSLRIGPVCRGIGEAVGIAASLCAKTNTIPRRLDVRLLRTRLAGTDSYLK